jgi:hypothetical protein
LRPSLALTSATTQHPGLAERRTRNLGKALANGEPEPEREASGIEKEIEPNQQRAASMLGQIAEEQRRVSELIERHKGAWKKDLERRLTDAGAVYLAAIVAMEQAREDLVEEVRLGVWLSDFPGTGSQVQTYLLPGDPETPRLGGPAYADVLTALKRDAAALPLRGPVRPSPASLRVLDASRSSSSASTKTGTFARKYSKATPVRAGLSGTC